MKSPSSYRKMGALDWFCLRAIAFYQRQISPRKGWRCAHARLHGGAGCSGFAREQIAQIGWRAAMPRVRARFNNCKTAGKVLHASVDLDKREQPAKKKPNANDTDHGLCNAATLLPDGICCLGEAALEGAACESVGCAEGACGCLSCW